MRKLQDKKSEILFFNKLADENNEYDAVPHHVYTKVAKICHKLLNHKRAKILEVGCGSGMFGKTLAQLGHKVIGIDISPEMVKNANHRKVKGYNAETKDLEVKSNFRANSFLLILCPGVLHHLPSLVDGRAIKNFRHWLKPNGWVVCWEPNGSNPITILSKILFKLVYRFTGANGFATVNETNHTFKQYVLSFGGSGFKLIFSKSFSDKSTVIFSNPVMQALVNIRWFLIRFIELLLPFPFSGVMLLMVFQRKSE